MTRKKSLTKGEIIAKNIIEQYNPKSVEDMQAIESIYANFRKVTKKSISK